MRGTETKKVLDSILDQYNEKIEKYIKLYCNQCFDSIQNGVNVYLDSMKLQLNLVSDELSQIRRQGQHVKYSEEELRSDLEFVRKWRVENE